MLDAMAPQKHHQHQSGAASPLLLTPIANVSSSLSSSSSASSSSSSSSSAPQQQQQQQQQQPQFQHHRKILNAEAHDDSKTTSTANSTTQQDSHNHRQAANSAISGTSSSKHLHNDNSPAAIQKSKTAVRDQTAAFANTKAPFLSSSPAPSTTTSTTPAAVPSTNNTTMTTSQLAQNHHHHSASNQHNNSGNVYQSSQRYSHHNNHSNSNNHSHHNHVSYATRSSNQQRGHNNNSNQKNSHLHHHHNHQHNQSYGSGNDHHHNQKHHQQQQQQQHQPAQQSLPLPFTSSSSSISLPGSDVASNSSSGANQRGSSCGPPHYVDLHVNAGECVSLQMLDGQEQFLTGPATITMISQQQNPPVPIPVQVPPGHMVHQIADENGTLRHIILSVMDIDDNSQLNSSVIDLPHGSFRINSHGELVSADLDGGSGNSNVASGGENETNSNQVIGLSSSSSSIAQQANLATGHHHLQHLPQHQQATTYYANYDGCPVANYEVATQNNINTNNSSNNNNNNISNNNNNLAIVEEAAGGAQHQQTNKIANDSSTNSRTTTTTTKIDDANDKSSNHISLPLESLDSNKTPHISDGDQQQDNASDQQTATNYPKPPEESIQSDQQMIADMQAQSSIDDPAAYQQQQQQVDQTNTMMAAPQPALHQGQMLSTVDEQALYGYPTCCYCCYCDPSQETAVAGHPQHHNQHQTMLAGSQPEPPPTMIKASDLSGTPPSSNIAGPSSRTDPASANGVLPYPPHHHHPQQQQPPPMMTPIQAADPSLDIPLNMSSAPLISSQALHPLTGQNGLVPMHAPNLHYPHEHLSSSSVGSSPPTKPHKASRGHTSNYTYKQTKAQQNSDRQHQANYNAGHHHYGNQSYNNMVAGSTYYHQDVVSGLSPSSYKSPPGQTAGGGLLSHPTVGVGSTAPPATQGNYTNSYSNYNQPSTMANIVSAAGKQQAANIQQGGHHQHQSANNSYNRSGELEHQLSQRNNRLDHQMGAASVAAPYGGLNSGYRTDKRQGLVGEKGSRFSGATSTAAGVVAGNSRVIPNNHVAMVNANATTNNHHGHHHHNNSHHAHHQTNSGNNSNSSSIGGSVSPFRPNRMKNNSYHHNNHLHQQHSLPPSNSRGSNSNQISSYSQKINKEELESTARPNQLTVKTGTGATKNLNANNAIPQQPLVTNNKHIRSNDRNSSSPSSNHSSFNNNQSHQSPHRPRAWQGKQQQTLLASNSANNVGLNSSTCGTPTPAIFPAADQQQHSAARKNQHHQLDQSATKQDSYFGSPDLQQHQVAERPNKGQQQPMVAGVAGPRTSRGKQKKCQKENIVQQQTNHKRQHSNDETRKSAKNHRPRSINEVQQQQQQEATKNLDSAEMNEQERFKNVQLKRVNRQETNSNKPNQANNNKLAKIDQQANEPASINKQPRDESHQVAEPTSGSEVNEAKQVVDSEQDHRDECQTIESRQLVESEQPAQCEMKTTITDEPQPSTRNRTEANASMMGQEARSCKSPGKGDSPARKKSKSSGCPKQSSPKSVVDTNPELATKDLSEDSSLNGAGNEDVLVVTSLPDQPSIELKAAQVKQTLAVSMRTSLSENNIQSLNNVAKSTQTTPQKQSATTDQVDTSVSVDAAKKKPETSQSSSNLTSKRKSSNGKTEQQFKLNSLPQVRLLNLNCVSVTANCVNLRWSYITSLAEKYGINHHNQQHQHHHSGNPKHSFCFDHYVVECSSAKNVDTNTLVSAKIVYQGCAMTCRINNLTPEKIYHFRIRRTALVPSNDADNLAVSEILSVTLPSIQQQQQQQQTKESTTSSSGGGQHKKQSQHNLMAASDSIATTLLSTSNSTAISASLTTARGNTSSQINAHNGNNSNNKSSSSHHHQNHHHHHHHHNHNHNHHPIKFSNLMRQCRNKIMATLGSVIQNSFSSYSDTKFALLLLVIFTIFAMLLAIFIHLYILPPVNE